ncbi:hypothetical protein HPB47_025207 [Ixodes persulcatus]|uniref:Uncharacterized protein n=1 Tax=Ixodes persulcatus TaxID=34615 RepID=A0AC60Q3D0_IXOPE|nr:hypothetical protein HPB47_025207 [Ixodes persulcatus]
MNHVWILRLHSLSAKQKLVDAKELTIKGGRCLVIDPANTAVKLKLHWVPYDVPNGQVKKELERYGKVSDITRDLFREKGFEAVESNTRTVRLTLKEGQTVDSLPHEIRVDGCKVLVVFARTSPALCLHCRRKGHIRRDCRVPRCTDCHRCGHEEEDCVKTYASMVRDRNADDQSDFIMDDAEAEEVVGASTQTTLQLNEGDRSAAEAVASQLASAPATSKSECVPQGPGVEGEKTAEPSCQEQVPFQRAAGPAKDSNDDEGGRDPASDVSVTDVEMGEVVKRLRDPVSFLGDSAAAETGTQLWLRTGPKKIRVNVKSRVTGDDNRTPYPLGDRVESLGRSYAGVTKMMFIVVAIFALCWMPYQTYNILNEIYPKINDYEPGLTSRHSWPGGPESAQGLDVGPRERSEGAAKKPGGPGKGPKAYRYINVIWFCCHWLAMSNSCYNPFIYAIYSERFSAEFNSRIRCCIRRPPEELVYGHSSIMTQLSVRLQS